MSQVTPYGSYKSKKAQVEEMFDHIAPRYDLLNGILSLGIHRSWRKKTIKLLAASRPSHILDVATGTGDLAIEAARRTKAEVTGIDLSEQMLRAGLQKAAKKGLSGRIKLMKADCESLPFPAGKFDAVMAAFGVRNFGNLEAGLKEMHRVLKPGKSVYILEFSRIRNPFFRSVFNFYFRTFCPLIGRLVSADKRAYMYLPESVSSFPSGDEFLRILGSCGFKDLMARELSMGVATIYTGVKKSSS